jgi:coenzyme F420-0:L-glutamate ligase/coenzyme F420-1:gamma-L-glutamate ligase
VIFCEPVTGLPEVRPGDDLAALLAGAVGLRDGDVLVVTSKVVSKAEGRVVTAAKEDALAGETDRVVARRGPTAIVRTRHGLVMAAAGIDASNTEPGTLVLLPEDPDASARRLREELLRLTGANVAVLVSDTSGRAWRTGQTDIALGAAGLEPLDDHAGRDDGYGNVLAVTAPALADEITAAADLVTGKLSRSPAALLRGLARLVLPAGEPGSGAARLIRPEEQDMFGLGAREAVLRAAARDDGRGFGTASSPAELAEALQVVLPTARVRSDSTRVRVDLPDPRDVGDREVGGLTERATAVAFAHGWVHDRSVPDAAGAHDRGLTLRPRTP